ncbi:hypothetical protein [Roseovarius sp.]|uniref:hypothetical protein n=1 Tax=Roseovarius sp. TaxID=1486281 RepID=UPI003A980E62
MAEIPSSTKYARQGALDDSTNRRETRSDGDNEFGESWEIEERDQGDSLFELVAEFGRKRPKTLLAGAILLGLGLAIASSLEDEDDDESA